MLIWFVDNVVIVVVVVVLGPVVVVSVVAFDKVFGCVDVLLCNLYLSC